MYIGIVLPAYNETESIYRLLVELLSNLEVRAKIIIVDDSANGSAILWASKALKEIKEVKSHIELKFIASTTKQGRGRAVNRGFDFLSTDQDISFFVQMDSDGSHSYESLSGIIEHAHEDFVIGSRYVENSKIIGWSITRRIFSRLVNMSIRHLFGLKIKDWTNGLRGYSRKSIYYLLNNPIENSGFIALTEEALTLSKFGINPREVPIVFKDREHGNSTVGFRELYDSVLGIYNMYKSSR